MFHANHFTQPPYPTHPERPLYPAGVIAHPRAQLLDDDTRRWTLCSFLLWALGATISLLNG